MHCLVGFVELPVSLSSMLYCRDPYQEVLIIHFVQDTIRTLADSVTLTIKLLRSPGAGILNKLINPIANQ